jgi:hypothetical protein
MAGKRIYRRKTLPKTFREGALAGADRRYGPIRAVLGGAQQVLEDGGGADQASFLRVRAAHRVMHLDQLLAKDELRLAQGQEIDRIGYLTGCAAWLRYANALGFERRARPVESLQQYMSRRAREQAAIEPAPATVGTASAVPAGPSPAADLSTGGDGSP